MVEITNEQARALLHLLKPLEDEETDLLDILELLSRRELQELLSLERRLKEEIE